MTDQPELDALIVRNIGDIGAAANRAKLTLDPRLWTEAGAVLKGVAAANGWLGHADGDAEEAWLSHEDWLTTEDDSEDPPFYLTMNERAEPGAPAEWTWLASFTGAWPNRGSMGLFVADDRLKPGAWKRQLRSAEDIVGDLVERGFRYDGSTGDLYVPFLVEADLLAMAFEDDAFDVALRPLADAVSMACDAQAELTRLWALAKA